MLRETWRGRPRVGGVLGVRGGGCRGGAVQRLVLEGMVLVLMREMRRGVREHGAQRRDATDNLPLRSYRALQYLPGGVCRLWHITALQSLLAM